MTQKSKIKISSNRSFGLVFFIVFAIYSFWPVMYQDSIRIWSLIISLLFLFLGLINSKVLAPLNRLWAKFGILLGSFIAPVIMGFVFFIVVTPIGILMKIFNKDLLNKKYSKEKETYWIKCSKTISTMRKQF